MRVFGLVLLLALLGCNDTAVQEENARLAGEATALKSRVEMLEALLRLERSVAPAASRAPGPRTLTLVAEKKDKSTQDRLAEEHQRAK
ncbi:MAG TPA: hypothetical protein VFX28_07820, partial [Methylomirabilota bacterium]|nr:hypothetical protein [Methylomirabilota bacterium]